MHYWEGEAKQGIYYLLNLLFIEFIITNSKRFTIHRVIQIILHSAMNCTSVDQPHYLSRWNKYFISTLTEKSRKNIFIPVLCREGAKDTSPVVFRDYFLNSTVGSYYIRLLQTRVSLTISTPDVSDLCKMYIRCIRRLWERHSAPHLSMNNQWLLSTGLQILIYIVIHICINLILLLPSQENG